MQRESDRGCRATAFLCHKIALVALVRTETVKSARMTDYAGLARRSWGLGVGRPERPEHRTGLGAHRSIQAGASGLGAQQSAGQRDLAQQSRRGDQLEVQRSCGPLRREQSIRASSHTSRGVQTCTDSLYAERLGSLSLSPAISLSVRSHKAQLHGIMYFHGGKHQHYGERGAGTTCQSGAWRAVLQSAVAALDTLRRGRSPSYTGCV